MKGFGGTSVKGVSILVADNGLWSDSGSRVGEVSADEACTESV